MKSYSVRIQLKLDAQSDDEAKRKVKDLLKEMPRIEGMYAQSGSIYNLKTKSVVGEVNVSEL